MASVWLARLQGKHGFEKLVAVKTILPQFSADVRFRQMFLDEAGIASRIEHTNVAQILDLGEQHDILYLVMEWVEGDSLSKLSRTVEKDGERLPLGILLRIMIDACSGLHAAHELCDAAGASLGVVHRDVSPQNMLVNKKGVVKVIDFGVAKARDRHAEETSSGVLKGKIQYMAPEQAIGRAVDRRADVWALGAILYRMLAGRPPFEAENQLATLHALSSGQRPPSLPSQVPANVAAIVRRALTHDVDSRFASAMEMQQALEAAIPATPNTTHGDVAAYVADRLAERIVARKQALALALESAAERTRVARVLKTSTEFASGMDMTPVPGRGSLTTSLTAPTASETVVPSMPQTSVLPGEGSIGTLASAALDAQAASVPPALAPRTALLGLSSAAIVLGALFLLTRTRASIEPTVAARPMSAQTAPMSPPAADEPTPTAEEPAQADPVSPSASVRPTPAVAPPSRTSKPSTVVPRTRATPAAGSTTRRRKIDDGF